MKESIPQTIEIKILTQLIIKLINKDFISAEDFQDIMDKAITNNEPQKETAKE